ncbi:dehydrogenase/reductase SDR family member on chromosome X [Schistocerca nitens]|uniref:dehydrogenase/reductase SDR family member on chromosome X n=1 Tax=Schistocerca nitens TaxID=7011 RepID=UPI002119710F|nr:dehydrogenase/reductase SDR family member on chromosome X [Schistocerca nitens]
MAINWKLIFKAVCYEIYYYVIGAAAIVEDFMNGHRNKLELVQRPGDVAVITGGARGIGVEVVKNLLKCDMHVIIGCRNTKAGERTIERIRSLGVTSGSAECFTLDMASFKSIKEFAANVTVKHPALHLLINNAGIMFVPFSLTEDGYESHFAVNYLGHCLLTHLLLPQLKVGGHSRGLNARIINVSSSAHVAGNINFKDFNLKEMYVASEAYAQSKLAQLLFTKKLESLLRESDSHVQVHAVHPGVVNTDLFNDTTLKKIFPWVPPLLFKTPAQGAITIMHACLSPLLEGCGGNYLSNSRVIANSPKADNKVTQDKLWDAMRKIVEVHMFGEM